MTTPIIDHEAIDRQMRQMFMSARALTKDGRFNRSQAFTQPTTLMEACAQIRTWIGVTCCNPPPDLIVGVGVGEHSLSLATGVVRECLIAPPHFELEACCLLPQRTSHGLGLPDDLEPTDYQGKSAVIVMPILDLMLVLNAIAYLDTLGVTIVGVSALAAPHPRPSNGEFCVLHSKTSNTARPIPLQILVDNVHL